MIIAFALGLIGAILVLANSKFLRAFWILVIAFFLTIILAISGIYLIINSPKETDSSLFFPMFCPLLALILLQIARRLYSKYHKKEIILYTRGLFPVRHEERFVTKREINITFALLILSVMIPYLVLILIK